MQFKIKVNGDREVSISRSGDQWQINEQDADLDISRINAHTFHVISSNKSYNIELLKSDVEGKQFGIRVNGKEYTLEAQDEQDLLLERLGMDDLISDKIDDLKAPMPGKVLAIHVKAGDEVEKGIPILILEAMKMENTIKASGSGTVKSLKVREGEVVEKGQVMVEFG